ncbi:MAG: response regulator, partial [Deinococcota bacterium]
QTQSGQQSKAGTGLGLHLSNQFVRRLGGTLNVHSERSKGSVFAFAMPVEVVQVTPKSSTTRHVTGLATAPPKPAPKILIADDKHQNRKLLGTLLSQVGFDVQEAENGQVALELWRAWSPDLIWMDIRMPVLDGTRAMQYIKDEATQQNKRVRIIALTASVFQEDEADILAAGFDGFVRKPFREQQIFDVMAEHLNVQYSYDDTPQHPTLTRGLSPQLSVPYLASLSEDVRSALEQASQAADIATLNQLVSDIKQDQPALAIALGNLVDDFEYDQLLDLLSQVRQYQADQHTAAAHQSLAEDVVETSFPLEVTPSPNEAGSTQAAS